jgi:hypothetical protein
MKIPTIRTASGILRRFEDLLLMYIQKYILGFALERQHCIALHHGHAWLEFEKDTHWSSLRIELNIKTCI